MPRTRPRLSQTQLAAWTAFLRAHNAVTRALERELGDAHGLTLSDYDVLVQLAQAPGGALRPGELARAVLLTRSGITRLVQGLERAGLVERVPCPDDQRGHLLRLTAGGRNVLRRASRTHLDGIRELFAAPFDDHELRLLRDLLGRLAADARDGAAEPDAA
jgi:DNA-binding MarR family transcriptional regulator